ncbi:CopG family transcriptional regulator [candidate division KSB1 bacterium]|nr:MAG: CopG family transcriptional regulator [candidate division KSB1 bacterium]MBC6948826.1 CopG family transcriptional regulator [candidate division KSB1 bacterium]MCE7941903.1 CopG family transcriptional regulator [Chlorobi bacterium CHB1]MDL1875892.1 CopG family transcriptional regulator [Cytophagia bacterium CHB2]
MKTIQLTIEDDLLDRINQEITQKQTNLSAFVRESLIHYLQRLEIRELEKKHRSGYSKHPVEKGEFDVWEDEQMQNQNWAP